MASSIKSHLFSVYTQITTEIVAGCVILNPHAKVMRAVPGPVPGFGPQPQWQLSQDDMLPPDNQRKFRQIHIARHNVTGQIVKVVLERAESIADSASRGVAAFLRRLLDPLRSKPKRISQLTTSSPSF